MTLGTTGTNLSALGAGLLELIAENTADVLALLEPHEPFRLLWANSPFRRCAECPEAARIGRPFHEMFPAVKQQGVYQILQQAAESGEPFQAAGFEYVNPQLGKKYGLPGDLTYWDWKLLPVHDPDDSVIGLLIMARDVTEAKARELTQKRLETILDTIPSGVIVAEGPECRAVLANRRAEELCGRKVEPGLPMPRHSAELGLLKPDGQLFPPEQLPLNRACLHGETVRDAEILIEHPDGRRISVSANAVPLYDEAGRVYGAVGAFEDVTAVKEAQETLRQAYVREHRIAETLQQALLPRVPEKLNKCVLASAYRPALEEAHVGGDFYDVFHPTPDLLGIVIGDVSGKGIRAAMRTAMAKYMLRGYAYEDPSPASVVERVNAALVQERETDGFVTLFYGVLDCREHSLVFANAGHEPPLCRTGSSGEVVELSTGGTALGIAEDCKYAQESVRLSSGDRLLLYTDGVTEARGERDVFGLNRVEEILVSACDKPPAAFIEDLLERVQEFCGGRLRDDVALLLVCME